MGLLDKKCFASSLWLGMSKCN